MKSNSYRKQLNADTMQVKDYFPSFRDYKRIINVINVYLDNKNFFPRCGQHKPTEVFEGASEWYVVLSQSTKVISCH